MVTSPPAGAQSEQAWLQAARAAMLRNDHDSTGALLAQALREHPASTELERLRAGLLARTGHAADAEHALSRLLQADPGDAASALTLARVLKSQDRTAAAAGIVRACVALASHTADTQIVGAAIDLLADMHRVRDAAAIAEAGLDVHPDESRLHAYAGMLAMQLGDFGTARDHYLFALHHEPRAFEWHAAIGLAHTLRYADAAHPDFALFRAGLQRDGLSALARAELHFALGKAHDDVADHVQASHQFQAGNAIRKRQAAWQRKAWRRAMQAHLGARPCGNTAIADPAFNPVFIVGVPRSGTTLLAELLSGRALTCNRGELPTLGELAQSPAMVRNQDRATLQGAARAYQRAARQDDAPDARWFIDKQPLNFRYVDLALALFPQAKIVHCRRDPRDTALSLWMQCFLDDVQGYSYDFADISIVLRDERRLMAHWRERFPGAIRDVQYETLVAAPQDTVASVADWIGLPPAAVPRPDASGHSIGSASLWQARQPVHSRSIGRWRAYATLLPELASLPAG